MLKLWRPYNRCKLRLVCSNEHPSLPLPLFFNPFFFRFDRRVPFLYSLRDQPPQSRYLLLRTRSPAPPRRDFLRRVPPPLNSSGATAKRLKTKNIFFSGAEVFVGGLDAN